MLHLQRLRLRARLVPRLQSCQGGRGRTGAPAFCGGSRRRGEGEGEGGEGGGDGDGGVLRLGEGGKGLRSREMAYFV